MGFDRIWAVEHHALRWYAHMSAPEIFLTWVAATHVDASGSAMASCACPFNYNHPSAPPSAPRCSTTSPAAASTSAPAAAPRSRRCRSAASTPTTRYQEVEEALRMIGAMWQGDDFEWHGDLLEVQAPPDATVT